MIQGRTLHWHTNVWNFPMHQIYVSWIFYYENFCHPLDNITIMCAILCASCVYIYLCVCLWGVKIYYKWVFLLIIYFFIFFSHSISLSIDSLLSLFVHSYVIISVQLYNCMCVYVCKCLYCIGAICEKCNADFLSFFIFNGKMIIFISQMLTNNCVLYCVCVCCWIM